MGIDLKEFDFAAEATSTMRPIMERYSIDVESLERKYPLALSEIRHERMQRFYSEWQSAVEGIDFDSLTQDDRIDLLLFRSHLSHRLQRLETQKLRRAEIDGLLPCFSMLIGLEEQRQRMQWANPEEAASLLNEADKQITLRRREIEAELEDVNIWKPAVANRAADAVGQLREAVAQWKEFYQGFDPLFTWWVDEPYKSLDKTLESYGIFLREHLAGMKAGDEETIIGDPLGRQALLTELSAEMIPYSPEELIEIGQKELAWCETEMLAAAKELGFPNGKSALEHVKTTHRQPGQQPEMIRQMAVEAVEFLAAHDLVTVPPLAQETWRMEMMSQEKQLVNPFFLGGEVVQVAFPTSAMSHEQKRMSLRGNNPHFARATVQHELIPGHHLQMFMMARHKTYRSVLNTAFWIEGWALYWEMLLWDMGFPLTAENKIGMLFWRSHRAARIVFSLKFHLHQMSAGECTEMLVERVGHERANAVAEVRRSFKGDYGPLYQAAYMLGGLQMMAMRRELVDTGKMSDRAFHDAVLMENSIPMEMVRASLTQQSLDRDFATNWRFYESL